jgi:hypothetical protein
MWTLLLFIVGGSGNIAMGSVPGFQTHDACMQAVVQVEQTSIRGRSIHGTCVEVK